jgi:hypothetical protein
VAAVQVSNCAGKPERLGVGCNTGEDSTQAQPLSRRSSGMEVFEVGSVLGAGGGQSI